MNGITGFTSGINWSGMLSFVLKIAAVLLCIVVHEVCHGLAAYWLGDPTAKRSHRLSLNPIRHIDLFGLIMMAVAGFGWAKPVPIDPRYFKKPKSGMAITALAGPVSNLLLAFLSAILINGAIGVAVTRGYGVGLQSFAQFLYMLMSLSIGLGIFNLIPFPPLDGAKILGVFLPSKTYFQLMRYEQYGMLLLIALLWFGWLDVPLYAVRSWLFNWMMNATSFAQGLAAGLVR